jgi:ABC-type transporter Mla MlaB component
VTLPAPAVFGSTLAKADRIVDCWIGISQEKDRRVVRLAGRLAEAQVPELLIACSELGPLELDLSDLVSADAAGLEALYRVQSRGAMLVGVPGYIRLQLESRSRMRGVGGKPS